MEKRICLLAGHDSSHQIQDYVVFLAREMSKISDIYYYADVKMPEQTLKKIRPYVQFADSSAHFGQDFGSWKKLIQILGWSVITRYKELVLINDSVYGPMTDLSSIFEKMTRHNYDFWGLTENYDGIYHLESYFMVFEEEILKNKEFQKFWLKEKADYSRRYYEQYITSFLTDLGFVGNSYIKNYGHEDMLSHPLKLIKQNQMPFVRVKSLQKPAQNLNEPILFIDKRISRQTGYDTGLIKKHLAADKDFCGFGIERYIHDFAKGVRNKIECFTPKI